MENLSNCDLLHPNETGKKHVKCLLDISIPNDEVLYVPSLDTNSDPYLIPHYVTYFIQDGYQWFERVRILSGKERKIGEWIS